VLKTGVSRNVRGLFEYIIFKAQRRFRDLFGYDLIAEKPPAPADNSAEPANKKAKASGEVCWYLINKLASDDANVKYMDRPDKNLRGLLFTILSFIMLEGRSITEEKLMAYLEGECREGEKALFGSGTRKFALKDAIKHLTSQLYLKRKVSKDPTSAASSSSATTYEYIFGTRSVVEIGEDNVLRFMKQCTGAAIGLNEAKNLLGSDDLLDGMDDDDENDDGGVEEV